MKIAAVVRALVAAGATPEMILAAVEAAEGQATDDIERRRANDAERQARRRERKAKSHVTSRDVTVTERDLPSLSPTPPNSNPLSPPIVPPSLVSDTADEIWKLAGKGSRKRSGVSSTETAVKAALRTGATPAELIGGCRGYFAETEDEHAKGVHRLIQSKVWRDFAPPPAKAPPAEDLEAAVRLWRETGAWSRRFGPPPDDPATLVPKALIAA
ncbi:MAG: hypothetical protein Q7T61_01045 [Caulobacter sp.]|nr:hypothetical protein [Caulobacter sp.]